MPLEVNRDGDSNYIKLVENNRRLQKILANKPFEKEHSIGIGLYDLLCKSVVVEHLKRKHKILVSVRIEPPIPYEDMGGIYLKIVDLQE